MYFAISLSLLKLRWGTKALKNPEGLSNESDLNYTHSDFNKTKSTFYSIVALVISFLSLIILSFSLPVAAGIFLILFVIYAGRYFYSKVIEVKS
jgi:hypothetical protein